MNPSVSCVTRVPIPMRITPSSIMHHMVGNVLLAWLLDDSLSELSFKGPYKVLRPFKGPYITLHRPYMTLDSRMKAYIKLR